MASVAETASYEQDRLDVIEDLKESGYLASFGKKGVTRVNHGLPSPFTEICTEYCLPLGKSELFNDIIQTGDTALIVSNQNYLLTTCELIDDNGTYKKIMSREQLALDNQTIIFYEVLIRG